MTDHTKKIYRAIREDLTAYRMTEDGIDVCTTFSHSDVFDFFCQRIDQDEDLREHHHCEPDEITSQHIANCTPELFIGVFMDFLEDNFIEVEKEEDNGTKPA